MRQYLRRLIYRSWLAHLVFLFLLSSTVFGLVGLIPGFSGVLGIAPSVAIGTFFASRKRMLAAGPP
jgi:hypothetical protein